MSAPVHEPAADHYCGCSARCAGNTVQPSFVVGHNSTAIGHADTYVRTLIPSETYFGINSIAGKRTIVDGVLDGIRDDVHGHGAGGRSNRNRFSGASNRQWYAASRANDRQRDGGAK